MATKIPTLPSVVPDPVNGLYHLPRLWEKFVLEKTGQCHPDYVRGSGFDKMICDHFGVNPDDLKAYVDETTPTLWQFCEKFGQLAAAAGKPISEHSESWNTGAATYEHSLEYAATCFAHPSHGGNVPTRVGWKANLVEDCDQLLGAYLQPAD